MKIGFIITDLDVGGAELALVRYVKYLVATGRHEVCVCSLKQLGPIAKDLTSLGIEVEGLGFTRTNVPLAYVRLAQWLRRRSLDVLCSFMFHANLLARISRHLGRVSVLLCFERTMGQEGRLRHFFNRATTFLCDGVVAVSPAVRESCRSRLNIPPQRLFVIGNGVDLSRFRESSPPEGFKRTLGVEAENFVVTCVANMRPIKGHIFLIEAFRQLCNQGTRASLLLVGDGPLKPKLQAAVRQHDIEDRVLFLGTVTDIIPILSATDLFILPSLTEGLCNALLEAMAAGRAVIATRVGGNCDVVEDGIDGVLVPPADPNALARAARELLMKPELRDRLGRAARAKVIERFSATHIGQDLERLISSFLVRDCHEPSPRLDTEGKTL